MTLSAGTRLGPYEILAPLGAGGMGEVWKATDARLDRTVALKVLPEDFFEDKERVARFEREAKLLAALNHPNIAAIFSFEEIPGVPGSSGRHVLVQELLEGDTLRQRLAAGPVPVRKAIDWGIQIAKGLAAAHEKGIVHRDLKPENLFVTTDGRLKILDFGLAKQRAIVAGGDTKSPTMVRATDPGTLLGTVGYMAPEQVKGQPADARSDIFAFGCVLYEMLAGRRAFKGDSAIETMNAILKDEPPEPDVSGAKIPPGLERLIRHCLEKSPEERFHSAHDLAFDLEALSAVSGAASPVRVGSRSRVGQVARRAVGVLLAFAAGAAVMTVLRKPAPAAPTFRQLTFRRGPILSARFGPDGQTIVYGAGWEGRPCEIFVSRPESPQSRPIGLPDADVLSVSPSGEMALMLSPLQMFGYRRQGVLARAPLAGGAPRPLRERVQWADWAPDGESLAVVTLEAAGTRLEFPAGRVVHTTPGWIGHPRVSPDGRFVAFCDHPQLGDDGGEVAVVGADRPKKTLTGRFASIQGLAFGPSGDEVWFTGATTGGARALYAVSLSGRQRLVLPVPGTLTLHDVDRLGRALLTRDLDRQTAMGLAPGESGERDLSELDYSRAMGLSADGKTVLFDETGEGGGPGYSVYVRRTDGAPAVRLGGGGADDLSPDGAWAIVGGGGLPRQLKAVPTGTGEPIVLTNDAINHNHAWWLAGSRRFAFFGNEPGRPGRLWAQDVGGAPRAISPEGIIVATAAASPDGRTLATFTEGEGIVLRPVAGGEPGTLPGGETNERPAGWSEDGRSLFLVKPGLPSSLDRVEIATGRREHVKDITPVDAAGLRAPIARVLVRANGRAYVYVFTRTLSELYLVEGLR
ncbi:MAG TPA: protein kinase [Thermoanaerobaculia bacterium]|nr:protein kinase [Thermoanaerobaculia bacterium]